MISRTGCSPQLWGHIHYSPNQASARLGFGGALAGSFTAATWTRHESEVSSHYGSKCVICLVYFQTCSRKQMTYRRCQAMLSPTLKQSLARLPCSCPRTAECEHTIPHSAQAQPGNVCFHRHWRYRRATQLTCVAHATSVMSGMKFATCDTWWCCLHPVLLITTDKSWILNCT